MSGSLSNNDSVFEIKKPQTDVVIKNSDLLPLANNMDNVKQIELDYDLVNSHNENVAPSEFDSFIIEKSQIDIVSENCNLLSSENSMENGEKIELGDDLANSYNKDSVESGMDICLNVSNGNLEFDNVVNTECTKMTEEANNAENFLNNVVINDTDELLIDDQVCNELSAQVFHFKNIPIQVTGAWNEFESMKNNYTKGCKWSPDGSCILTCSNDNILRIFNCPTELWEQNFSWENIKEMQSVLQFTEGDTVFDYSWYPLMSSYDPVTCCFAAISRHSTVHLWDAFTGALRCSYRPYNHLDEISTPHSLAFDLDGQKLYCGFNKTIRIFDVSQPGRECKSQSTYEKKNEKYSLPGIISCFAFNPVDKLMFAAGGYSKYIGLYSENYLEMVLKGHHGGVTHLCFSPDGKKLYSGARKDSEILCWDIRNAHSPLFSIQRNCRTNQRMYFDITKCGRFLVSGNTNGVITIFDLTSSIEDVPTLKLPILKPFKYFQAHEDCVNGVSLHPTMPLLATSSGQRLFPEPVDDDSDDEDELFSYKSLKSENCLKLWWDTEMLHDT